MQNTEPQRKDIVDAAGRPIARPPTFIQRLRNVTTRTKAIAMSCIAALTLLATAIGNLERILNYFAKPQPAEHASPTASATLSADAEAELPPVNPPPFDFPSLEIAGVQPLSEHDRLKESFAHTRIVIRNETNKGLKLAFAYPPYRARNPEIGASRYVQRESPEMASGVSLDHREDNFGGPVHISIFANGKWTATNEWFDLGVVPLRTVVVTEQDDGFHCRVEFEEDSK